MSTVTLFAYANAFPSVTNRMRASVALSTNPLAIVRSIIDNTSGHPQRTYVFSGLPRAQYTFSLDEIDSSGNKLANFAKFDVVPSQVDGLLSRKDEQVTVGITPGFEAGANSFVFDGTGTPAKPNYIGWDIVPSELTGRGILVKDVDYSWDSTTATFTLLITNDIFSGGTVYNIHFNDAVQTPSSLPSSINDFKVNRLTASTTLDASFFGDKLLIEPAGDYIEITLPDIATVVEGRRLMVEVDAPSLACVRFKTLSGQTLKTLRGSLYVNSKESLNIYKYDRMNAPEYRIEYGNGNYTLCGANVSHDFIQSQMFYAKLMDGSAELVTKYARIYNEVVLNLPISQRCNFDEWSTGNNKYLYSLANSSDPSNAGKFHFPNRLGLYQRNNNTGKAGDYLANQNKIHAHNFPGDDSMINWNADPTLWTPRYPVGETIRPGDLLNTGGIGHRIFLTSDDGGTEARPETILINSYIIV